MLEFSVAAGYVSTLLFAVATLPMVIKALATRDLASYSRSNLLLVNGGNLVHSIYIYSLPPGPIWLLHACYLATSVVMLVWHLRFGAATNRRSASWRSRNVAMQEPSAASTP